MVNTNLNAFFNSRVLGLSSAMEWLLLQHFNTKGSLAPYNISNGGKQTAAEPGKDRVPLVQLTQAWDEYY